MKIAYDFHIHSGLSPCSEDEMTPNNVINMAKLKGLDVIAITDHNSTLNLQAFLKVADKKEILIIPGAEITSKEEVHLLTLFSGMEEANDFQKIINQYLPQDDNNTKIFGNQRLYNERDEIIGEYEFLLNNTLSLSLEEIIQRVYSLNGAVIPAHIDRHSYSILSNLGFISPNLMLTTLEITMGCNLVEFNEKYPYLKDYRYIVNSDAHHLGSILERQSFLEVERLTAEAVIDKLRSKKEN
ncbi:PHP domain-containing protein [Alkaliphilus serpentinus]|uniref:PHP domain-containing protein n=1 Tax=Alkaliphilus serpentinus TaxID=1482731 RepID=A0A833HQ15_9FIRM|nr:PHP domain-containing protein [Alkaliphilus serpentinus]KAB3531454.1 PHP domain-containing protein [Alkaliphilus serpentinus]